VALLARHGTALRCQVLPVPHHRSRTSSTEAFMLAVAPGTAQVQAATAAASATGGRGAGALR
jgi:beta-lactamase superfamily II metal-dependent hydrolase